MGESGSQFKAVSATAGKLCLPVTGAQRKSMAVLGRSVGVHRSILEGDRRLWGGQPKYTNHMHRGSHGGAWCIWLGSSMNSVWWSGCKWDKIRNERGEAARGTGHKG